MTFNNADARAALQAGIRRIWENSRGVVSARIDVLEELATARANQTLTQEQQQTAAREAHKLAGALGTFGFPGGSVAARELELLLIAGADPDARRWSDLVQTIRAELEHGPTLPAMAGETAPTPGLPVLAIHQPDKDFVEALTQEALPLGLQVRACDTAHELSDILAQDPAAVVIDPWLGGPLTLELLSAFAKRRPDAPLIVLSDRDELTDRVTAARTGVSAFLSRPQAARDVAAQLAALMPGIGSQPPGVLAVADDANVRSALADAMSAAGFKLAVLDEPMKLWDAIAQSRPDLLILDADTRDISGVELCRVIRSDTRWRGVPVIVLSASADASTLRSVYAAGADDVVERAAISEELSRRIAHRLHRTELTRSQADTDFLTGVATRRKSEEAIGYLMSLSVRSKQPVSVALLDIDHFKRINDEFSHAVGDVCLRRFAGMLRQTFRGVDVISRWAGEEFVVGLYGMAGTGDLLDRLSMVPVTTHNGSPIHVSFSAGVAQYPQDGQTLDQLVRASDQALELAKTRGRSRVVLTGSLPSDQADVLIVSADSGVARQVIQALETRGRLVQHIADGDAAIVAMRAGSIRPKLIVLDSEVGGTDGLGVLRRLRADKLLAHSRVIMLTAPTAESAILESLELDAFDHVPKPFTTSVLMQRVRRALA
jgi:diguanylate cyclase (GGDEF)-like protein